MTSFLTDQEVGALEYLGPFAQGGFTETIPNPWTGISTQLFILVAMTGQLVRRNRLATLAVPAIRSSEVRSMVWSELKEEALTLEARLVEYKAPTSVAVRSTGDDNTPVTHLLIMMNCYRLAALLELYTAFPTLAYRKRNPSESFTCQDEPIAAFYQGFILDLTTAILTLLGSLPQSSGTKSSQLFPLLVAAAALKPYSASQPDTRQTSLVLELKDISQSSAALNRWRDFVCTRMVCLRGYIGLHLLDKVSRVIQEVWYRCDNEASPELVTEQITITPRRHWIDVMCELHLETILG